MAFMALGDTRVPGYVCVCVCAPVCMWNSSWASSLCFITVDEWQKRWWSRVPKSNANLQKFTGRVLNSGKVRMSSIRFFCFIFLHFLRHQATVDVFISAAPTRCSTSYLCSWLFLCAVMFVHLCVCLSLQGWPCAQQKLSIHHPRASPQQCAAHASESCAHIYHGG